MNVISLTGRKSIVPPQTAIGSWTNQPTVNRIVNKLNKVTKEKEQVYWSVQLECSECRFNWGELIKKEKRGEALDCIKCGAVGTAHERITAPNTMGVGTRNGQDSGAYPDGMRAKSDTWKRAKEAADLSVQAVRLPYKKRGEINKEIEKVKKGK